MKWIKDLSDILFYFGEGGLKATHTCEKTSHNFCQACSMYLFPNLYQIFPSVVQLFLSILIFGLPIAFRQLSNFYVKHERYNNGRKNLWSEKISLSGEQELFWRKSNFEQKPKLFF